MDALLVEEHMQFEEVLRKFLLKHSSRGNHAQSFLEQLSRTLIRSSAGRDIEKYIRAIKKCLDDSTVNNNM